MNHGSLLGDSGVSGRALRLAPDWSAREFAFYSLLSPTPHVSPSRHTANRRKCLVANFGREKA